MHPNHRAHHITVNVQITDLGRASDLGNGFINTRMNAKRQTIAGSVNLLDQLWELVTVVTHHMHTDLGRASDLGNGFINTRMNAKRQTIAGSVNLLDQLWELVTVVTHHMQHRTKDLFL